MNNLKVIVSFTVGAVSGALITLALVKKKYQKKVNDEVREVREYYKKLETVENEPVENEEFLEDMSTFSVKEYNELTKPYSNEKKGEPETYGWIRVISPDEFADNDYDATSLNYYADGVLTDDWDNPIEDIDDTVGSDFFTHFGDYDDDTVVYIRNDRNRMDYEIIRDERDYADVKRTRRHSE